VVCFENNTSKNVNDLNICVNIIYYKHKYYIFLFIFNYIYYKFIDFYSDILNLYLTIIFYIDDMSTKSKNGHRH